MYAWQNKGFLTPIRSCRSGPTFTSQTNNVHRQGLPSHFLPIKGASDSRLPADPPPSPPSLKMCTGRFNSSAKAPQDLSCSSLMWPLLLAVAVGELQGEG